jgi:hypothetical protein
MFAIVIDVVGMLLAFLYVGFLAYSIGAIPLWVIVIATFLLMIYALVGNLQGRRAK